MPPNKQSAIVYGCMVYATVSDADAGFGAFSASAVKAIQGEMSEKPLEVRRHQMAIGYH